MSATRSCLKRPSLRESFGKTKKVHGSVISKDSFFMAEKCCFPEAQVRRQGWKFQA